MSFFVFFFALLSTAAAKKKNLTPRTRPDPPHAENISRHKLTACEKKKNSTAVPAAGR
jgi:hypothetical protein